MKRILTATVAAVATVTGLVATPADAVIHEIYAAWCAGKGEMTPRGISDDTQSNFAKPVFAGKVVALTPHLDGVLIDFDFERAQAKIVPAPDGPAIVQIAPGLYLERFVIDPNFPGFLNCAKLESLAG